MGNHPLPVHFGWDTSGIWAERDVRSRALTGYWKQPVTSESSNGVSSVWWFESTSIHMLHAYIAEVIDE